MNKSDKLKEEWARSLNKTPSVRLGATGCHLPYGSHSVTKQPTYM